MPISPFRARSAAFAVPMGFGLGALTLLRCWSATLLIGAAVLLGACGGTG